jgi:hypothetical protein
MLQNDAEAAATADTQPAKAPALLDPSSPIEVASSGSGSTNDPGPDIRPPVMAGDILA